ncbi:MAG: HepT-like ribonuclease domain-containing protein [Thermogutta sp.]
MRCDDAYLLDMLLAARDAQEFARGLTRKQFEESRLHQLAILKALETIGEAAARVSESFRIAHPDIPWRAIVGMRNRLVHAYFEVDLDEVWDTVQNDLPPLIAALELLVPPEET